MSFLSPNSLSLPAAGRSEYGRVKVALPRGKGLLDWVRLTTGKVLAKKTVPVVDDEELARHSSREDCWVHLFGNVYDVSAYLDFHPGGVEELMRASGRDATGLFTQYHPWVNYENFLKSCYVGKFEGDLTKLRRCDPPTDVKQSTYATVPAVNSLPPKALNISVSNPTAETLLITSPNWKCLCPVNIVVSCTKTHFRVLVRHFNIPAVELFWEHLDEEMRACKYTVSCESDRVKLKFESTIAKEFRDDNCAARKRPLSQYHPCKVEDVRNISHDTILIRARKQTGLYMPIPLGHHISMKIRKGDSKIYRPYTPVDVEIVSRESGKPQCDNGVLTFMVKTYPNGICSPIVGNYKRGLEFEISDPIGDKDFMAKACNSPKCLYLAAGSGLTPLIGLIDKRIANKELAKDVTCLLLFNKTEKDIIEDDWMPFTFKDDRFETVHVLSEASSEWTGLRGRICRAMLPDDLPDWFIFVCGPDGFVLTTAKILTEAGCKSELVHVFQG